MPIDQFNLYLWGLAIQTAPARIQRGFPLKLTETDGRRELTLSANKCAFSVAGSHSILSRSRSLQLNRRRANPVRLSYSPN